ncbi:MAG: hypothetical protein IJT38_01300 [Clostridia bacterium]|nr:hypothetical protein [Clostridia bacterium]
MLTEKVAYLRGLCEGLDIDDSKPEGKLLVNIIDVLDEIANEVTAIDDTQFELQNEIDEIDEDLADVEDYLFGEDEDDFDDFLIEDVECPYCGESIAIDSDILDSEDDTITCPACGKEIELEFEDCGCDCGCCDNDEE